VGKVRRGKPLAGKSTLRRTSTHSPGRGTTEIFEGEGVGSKGKTEEIGNVEGDFDLGRFLQDVRAMGGGQARVADRSRLDGEACNRG